MNTIYLTALQLILHVHSLLSVLSSSVEAAVCGAAELRAVPGVYASNGTAVHIHNIFCFFE